MKIRQFAIATTVIVVSSLMTEPSFADPPPWAPAHGYRAKHKGKPGRREANVGAVRAPVDLEFGVCDRDVIGAVLGGAAGGVLGSTVGSGSGKTAAIVGGTIIGAIVGGSIGRSMDSLDQNCVGQVLENASDGQTIVWQGANNDEYEVTPTRTFQTATGTYCREYTTEAMVGGRLQTVYGRACRQPDGAWKLSG